MKIKNKTITGRTTRYSTTVETKKGDMLFTTEVTQGDGYDVTIIDTTFVEKIVNEKLYITPPILTPPTQEEIDEAQAFVEMNVLR